MLQAADVVADVAVAVAVAQAVSYSSLSPPSLETSICPQGGCKKKKKKKKTWVFWRHILHPEEDTIAQL